MLRKNYPLPVYDLVEVKITTVVVDLNDRHKIMWITRM